MDIFILSLLSEVLIMPDVSRIGDKVIMNCPHGATGTIISCSTNIEINGNGLARKGDIIKCDKCGVTRIIGNA